jgi:hypothetical protein
MRNRVSIAIEAAPHRPGRMLELADIDTALTQVKPFDDHRYNDDYALGQRELTEGTAYGYDFNGVRIRVIVELVKE